MSTTEAGSDLDRLKNRVHDRFFAILREAHEHSADVLQRARSACDRFIDDEGIDPTRLSIVAVGSVGRHEALSASDLDLVPIFSEPGVLSPDQVSRLRDRVRDELGIDVSKGQDLTRECSVDELAHLETIGGEHDETNALTRRVLVLTESAEVSGELGLATIRRRVLDAYSKHETTSGRHVLSISNDVARYYRTLCIDYKAKVDTRDKAWCPRNAKLRHSRKFWYFSTMTAIVAAAIRADRGLPLESLLTYFAMPPVRRLLCAVEALGRAALPAAQDAIESYAWFLHFMSEEANRKALENVAHEDRYAPTLDNPFPALKFNSDVLHDRLIEVLDGLPGSARDRILRWFLL